MREAETSWGLVRLGSPDPVWPRLDPDPTIITGVGVWPESPSPGDLDQNQPGSEIFPQSGPAAQFLQSFLLYLLSDDHQRQFASASRSFSPTQQASVDRKSILHLSNCRTDGQR